jgi:hypothetical protein
MAGEKRSCVIHSTCVPSSIQNVFGPDYFPLHESAYSMTQNDHLSLSVSSNIAHSYLTRYNRDGKCGRHAVRVASTGMTDYDVQDLVNGPWRSLHDNLSYCYHDT